MPVLLMIGLMFWFSSDSFSGDRTESMLDQMLAWLVTGLSRDDVRLVNFLVRKSAHFVEYALLAALLYRGFRQDDPRWWRWKWALCSLAILAVWAALDEYRQSLTETRGPSAYDVLLDISGGLSALALIALVGRSRDRRARKELSEI
jgi:VanZ family protein